MPLALTHKLLRSRRPAVKVDLDGSGDSSFFGFIVAAMSIVPIALPIFIRIYMQFFGSLEMRMMVKDSAFE